MSDFEQLANAVDLQGRIVVDVGCGDGTFVRALARAGAEAIGIEVSEDAVARARAQDPDHRYLLGGAAGAPAAGPVRRRRDAHAQPASRARSELRVPGARARGA